jgi:GNAT superfamily N-acetyltransferase
MKALTFLPINLDLHSDLCIRFRSDSFVESFGSDKPFFEEDGLGDARYLDWLKSRISTRYGGFHIWLNGEIVGQMELGERKNEDDFGYINLYYLVPQWRGKGLSEALDKFAMDFLRSLGFKKARLSVSPTNLRAVQFYKKNGWADIGERTGPEASEVLRFPIHYMEKYL